MKIFILLVIINWLSFYQAYSQQKPVYVLEKKISIPGNGGYDYLSIDKPGNRLYVSHGTSVNVVDLSNDKVIGAIENMKGVHGIAIANEFNKGFISDGRANSVVVFDLKTLKKLETIPVKGEGPDAIMYDPYTKRVFSFNGESHNASVIDASTAKEIGSVDLPGGPEFAVSNGIGRIYDNIEDKNSVVVIDSKNLEVTNTYSLAPGGTPTGMAIDLKNHRLFSGCRADKNLCILNENTGAVITRLPIGAGVDAVCYDPVTSFVICSNGDGTTTVIKQESADSYKVIQTINTQVRAKTMALDPLTHKIYLSVAKFESGSRTPLPDSFEVLVYKLQ